MNPDTKALAVEATQADLVRQLEIRRNLSGSKRMHSWDERGRCEIWPVHRLCTEALTALTQPPPVSEIRERVARLAWFIVGDGLDVASAMSPENDAHWEHWKSDAKAGTVECAMATDVFVLADAILALLPQPPGSDGEWQTIESAPRDGTRVLLYGALEANAPDAADNYRWSTRTFPASVGEGYFAHGVWQFRQHAGIPTHWRPLPTPPSPSTVADGGEEGT